MDDTKLFEKYRSRLVKEGIIKSLMAGFIAGFVTDFIVALVCWLCNYKYGLWLGLGLGCGVGAAIGVLLYFLKFRPDDKDVARRVDALGLEERMITMLELENDGSYIALRQREDARIHAKQMNRNSLKLRVSALLIALVPVAFVPAVSMSTVSQLYALGVIPGGGDIMDGEAYIEISYVIEEGGEIDGESDQILLKGEDAEPIIAVAEDGWAFVGWDDGINTPYREDKNLTENTVFTAIFMQISDDGDPSTGGEDGDFDADGGDEEAPDAPNGDPGEADGDGDGSGGKPSDGEGTGSDGMKGDDNQGGNGQGDGGGGRYQESNNIIDGNEYYRDHLDDYKSFVEEYLANNPDLTEEEREFIEKYFGSL